MDLKDVSYYVKRKQGFPSITDLGVADIFLGGSGLSFKMKLSTAEKSDRQNFFKVDKVDVDVKNFNIKLKQSKHKTLFALFKPIMLKVLRPALQKVLEKQIKDQIHELDSLAYQIKLEADRAQKEVSSPVPGLGTGNLTICRSWITQRMHQISTVAMSMLPKSRSCKASRRHRRPRPLWLTRRSTWR